MRNTKRTVYICGPMRGIAGYNFAAFDAAAEKFRRLGWDIINPAQIDRNNGFDPAMSTVTAAYLRQAIRRDVELIAEDTDALAVLPGWENSAGCAVEMSLARMLGLELLDAETGRPLATAVRVPLAARPPVPACPKCNEPSEKAIWPENGSRFCGNVECSGSWFTPADDAERARMGKLADDFADEVDDAFKPAAQVRTFETGATRGRDDMKPDYEGFFSPAVFRAVGEYMHKHRIQPDGQLRDSDNWQRGIPLKAYMKSLWRHFMQLWTIHRGGVAIDDETGEVVSIADALGGMFFNVQGYFHEHLKQVASSN